MSSARPDGEAASVRHAAIPTRVGTSGDRGTNAGTRGPRPDDLARLLLELPQRDLALLGSIAALHWVTTRQVQRLHFPAGGRGQGAALRVTQRCLARLHRLGAVDRLARRIGGIQAGSAGYIWRLSPAGARLVGLDARHRARQPGLAHLAHVLDVADTVVQLYERARTGTLEIVDIQTEPDCWRVAATRHGRRLVLKPDLRTTLGVDSYQLHWFIEVDRNTEHRATLQRKILAYVAAWQDGSEQARAGVFPRVLWIVPDQRRADFISDLCNATSGVPAGMFTAVPRRAVIAALTTR